MCGLRENSTRSQPSHRSCSSVWIGLTTSRTHPRIFLPVPDVLREGQRIVASETGVKPQRMVPSNNRNAAAVKELAKKEYLSGAHPHCLRLEVMDACVFDV